MRLLDYTSDSALLPRQECRDLEDAVSRLVAALVADDSTADPQPLVAEIMQREVEGSTVLAGGLAIPHARFETVRRLRLAVATLTSAVAGTGADDNPVDIVVLIVGPRDDPRQMLRLLARLARLVKKPGFLDRLRAADSTDSMRRVLSEAEPVGT
jgi:mannitol/fructose-specific phosphotransferase system IIA component (Ntr-type)